MDFEVKKLYRGYASVRDYIVKRHLIHREILRIIYKGKVMTVSPDKLKRAFQFHRKEIRSKYNNRTYQLVDFKFIPDEEETKQWKFEF